MGKSEMNIVHYVSQPDVPNIAEQKKKESSLSGLTRQNLDYEVTQPCPLPRFTAYSPDNM